MTTSAAEVLRLLGGTATRLDILAHTTRAALHAALARGEVTRISRGVYALTDALTMQTAAAQLRGVLSHRSAAAYWLMESMFPASSIHVTLPRNSRRLAVKGTTLHYADIDPLDLKDPLATSPVRTVLDCAVTLPFREALAIADSALRRDLISPDELSLAADRMRGAGRQHALRVARHADSRADNPFESGLRGTVIDSGITGFVPQLVIPEVVPAVRVDLGDDERRMVLEADSFTFHGSREALKNDCLRYDELTSYGWLVLRFAYEHVMYRENWAREVLTRTCALRPRARGTRRSRH